MGGGVGGRIQKIIWNGCWPQELCSLIRKQRHSHLQGNLRTLSHNEMVTSRSIFIQVHRKKWAPLARVTRRHQWVWTEPESMGQMTRRAKGSPWKQNCINQEARSKIMQKEVKGQQAKQYVCERALPQNSAPNNGWKKPTQRPRRGSDC